MATSDKPSTRTQGKAPASPDKRAKTDKAGELELTQDELKKVSGGVVIAQDDESPKRG